MKNDKIFAEKRKRVDDFVFDKNVADAFDDMLDRSVPFYSEVQRMTVELAATFCKSKTDVYDLGCSTGNAINRLCNAISDKTIKFVGVDNSEPMIEKTREKLKRNGNLSRCELIVDDLINVNLKNPSVVIMNYTLQFVRPLNRDILIKKIYDNLADGGCLLLTEKVLGEETILNRTYIDLYYDFKRRLGYSEMEISQKREALENILVPYRVNEDIELLRRNGFEIVDIFFKWYNFAAFIAVKHQVEKKKWG